MIPSSSAIRIGRISANSTAAWPRSSETSVEERRLAASSTRSTPEGVREVGEEVHRHRRERRDRDDHDRDDQHEDERVLGHGLTVVVLKVDWAAGASHLAAASVFLLRRT